MRVSEPVKGDIPPAGIGDEAAFEPGEDEEFEVGDELDLHTFAPRDVPSLVPDYIEACLERGFAQVRIIHGKGKGVQRRIVHAALDRHPGVVRYELAEPFAGGWGATIAWLVVAEAESP
jgi:dsDNA-specific endonuclease/ATPase MutS2